MPLTKLSPKDALAQARSVHLSMRQGAISYEKAKELTKPILDLINSKTIEIAQKHRVRPRKIKFQDLGRSF